MEYKKFIIENYKAIKHIEIPLSNSVIPLIGVNESGKTTILNAILAFDSSKDSLMNGKHINPKNKYKTSQEQCRIIAEIVINKDEFEIIGKYAKLNMDSELYIWLKEKADRKESICIERVFEKNKITKDYRIINTDIDDEKIDKVTKGILKYSPNILYFDDFSDRVPEKIPFPKEFAEDGKYSRGSIREWQEIIAEIFNRALEGNMPLKEFMELEDEDDKMNYLNDVEQILNRMIIKEWDELKNVLSSEVDGDLALRLNCNETDGEFEFTFKIHDREKGDKNRVFNIGERSKGFQWFFNFNMKLKFNPKYETHPDNAIYLLDEPGSYLHSSAQTELLKKLCEIANNNTIIYCTHSQYLLDPDIINIGNIRIIEKEEGDIKIEEYGTSKTNKATGAFSALNDALQLKFGMKDNSLKNVILTEGIIDYYFINMFLNLPDITIIPGSGAGHLKELISIMIGCSENYLVILDNDSAGRNARKEYKDYFKKSFEDHCYQYEGIGDKAEKFELEDLLGKEYGEEIKREMNNSNIKRALTELYFSDDETKGKIIELMPEEISKRIKIFERKILENFN